MLQMILYLKTHPLVKRLLLKGLTMIINKIIMHKYKRFGFLGKETLDVDLTNRVILVEGKNGSGKSSFFNEATPLPSDKKDYFPGGYKKTFHTHNGNEYELTSSFENKSPKYSFLFNGEELNEAGIISTQRLLVKQHFNITPITHDITIGKELFTNMTPAGRKKLFSNRTKLNLDHILKGYAKINEEFKLTKLMLANEVKQYQLEELKLMDKDELVVLKESLSIMERDVDHLLDIRAGIAKYFNPESSEEAYLDVITIRKEIEALKKEHYTIFTSYPKNAVLGEIKDINDNILILNNELNTTYSKLEELDLLLRSLDDEELLTIKDLDELREALTSESVKIEENTRYLNIKSFNNPTLLNEVFYRTHNQLNDILGEFPANLDHNGTYLYSKEKVSEYKHRADKLIEENTNLMVLENTIKGRRDSVSNLGDGFTCPHCELPINKHNLLDPNEIAKEMSSIAKRRVEIKEELDSIKEYLDSSSNYTNDYRKIIDLSRNHSGLLDRFWEDVNKDNLILTQPKVILNLLVSLDSDRSNIERLLEIERDIVSIDERKKLLESLGENNIESVKAKIDKESLKATDIRNELRESREHLTKLNFMLVVYERVEALHRSLEYSKDRSREYNLSIITSKLFNILDNNVRDLRSRINETSTLVNNQNTIQYTLDAFKKRIDDLEETSGVLGIILNELSPKSGLIAKTTTSFLNNIINNVNNTISKIWSYDMVLTPIDLTNGDLDYKFKVNIAGHSEDVDDISLTSKGQQEGINLSFKLMEMKLNGMDNYPLYLDELASNMDVVHTNMMSRLISGFVNTSNFSQIFIISHKEDMSFMTDAQVISLS